MVDKASVEDEKLYRVKMTRSVPFGTDGRIFLTPATDNVLKGKVITDIPDDAIESIEDVITGE